MRTTTCLVSLLTLLTVGCGDAYLKASQTFATAASASATTLADAPDFNHTLCSRRTQINYLKNRLEGTNTGDGALSGARIYWSQWAGAYKHSGDVEWQTHCKATQASDAVFNKALTALGAYADALATVAGEDYSGKDIGSLVTDIDGLAASIPNLPGVAATAIKPLGGSADAPGPIGQLAGALKTSYSKRRVRDIVKQADPAIKVILTVLTTYLAAIALEETQWESDTRELIDLFDVSLRAEPGSSPVRPEAVALMELTKFAEHRTHEIETTRAAQAATSAALQSLSAAEDALVKANGDNNSPNLPTVLGLAAQVLGDVAAVRVAIQGGAAQ